MTSHQHLFSSLFITRNRPHLDSHHIIAPSLLLDNHDIVSLSVYADEATMEKAEKEKYGEVVRFETSAQGMVFSEKLVR